jgi:hypothetical protein
MIIKAPPGELVQGLHEWDRYGYDRCEALNWSRLKAWKGTCPAKAQWLEDNQSSDAEHFLFGERVHCRVLEPERWKSDYIVRPKAWPHGGGHLRATPKSHEPTTQQEAADNRAEKDKWELTAKGREVVDGADGDKIEAMAQRLFDHPITGPMLKGVVGNMRNELVCVSQLGDQWVKGLIDIELCVDDVEAERLFDPYGKLGSGYFAGGVWLGDIKTTSSGAGTGDRPGSFGYSCAKYDYIGQAAWYMDGYERATGIRPAGFFFVPVEKDEPYEPAVYFVPDDLLKSGRRLYERLLANRQRCVKAQKFPGHTEYMHPLSVPAWGLEPKGLRR